MLCVVNAHQSLAVEKFWGVLGERNKGAPDDARVQIAREVLQTGVAVPVYAHALSDEQHAHSRLIFSSLAPLA